VLGLSACGGVGGLDPQVERSLARAAVDAGQAAELASLTTTVSSRAIALERASALALAEAEAALHAARLRDEAVAAVAADAVEAAPDQAQDLPQDPGLDAARMGLIPSAPGAGPVTAGTERPAKPPAHAEVAPIEMAAAPGPVRRAATSGQRGAAPGEARDHMVFITTPLPDETAATASARPVPAMLPAAASRGPALAAAAPAVNTSVAVALASSAAPPAPLVDCGLGQGVSEILTRINSLRARGARCGSKGSFGAAPALGWNGLLQVAAAGHALDMAVNNYFAHESPQGQTLAARAAEAQYRYLVIAENIAAGQPTLDAVLATWMASDTHCANLMHPGVRELALACDRADGARYATYWTLNLGASL
jgi:uncharacterized protein YkwD